MPVRVRIPEQKIRAVAGDSFRVAINNRSNSALLLDARGRPIPINSRALDLMPGDAAELRKRLGRVASHYGDIRRAQAKKQRVREALELLSDMKKMFGDLATATSFARFHEGDMQKKYRIGYDRVMAASEEFPQIKPLARLIFEEAIWIPASFGKLEIVFKSPPRGHPVIKRDKDKMIIDVPKKGGYQRMAIFRTVPLMKKEAKRRVYLAAKIMRGLYSEAREQDAIIGKQGAALEGIPLKEEASALLSQHKKLSSGAMETEAMRGMYDFYKGHEDRRARTEKEARIAKARAELGSRVRPLKSTAGELEILGQAYEGLAAAKSFEDAASAMSKVSAALATMGEAYKRDIQSIPELAEVAKEEAVSLLIPRSRKELAQILESSQISSVRNNGAKVFLKYKGEPHIMPTTPQAMNDIASRRLALVRAGIGKLRERIAKEESSMRRL